MGVFSFGSEFFIKKKIAMIHVINKRRHFVPGFFFVDQLAHA